MALITTIRSIVDWGRRPMSDIKNSLRKEEYKKRKLLFLEMLCGKVGLDLADILADGLNIDNLPKDEKYNIFILISQNLQIYKNIG